MMKCQERCKLQTAGHVQGRSLVSCEYIREDFTTQTAFSKHKKRKEGLGRRDKGKGTEM